MPFLVLLLLALTAGVTVYLLARAYPTAAGVTPPATEAAGEKLAEEAVRHPWFARLLRGRLDPGTATGLALTVALAITVVGGVALGALAYLVRSSGYLTRLDASVGGLGGCPFAPGASGNVPIEDLVHALAAMGVDTGCSVDGLIEAARLACASVGRAVGSHVGIAGPRFATPVPSPG